MIQEYINQKKEQYIILHDFIESKDDLSINFQLFIDNINNHNIDKTKKEMQEFLHLLLKITNNHYQDHQFYEKIEKIISFYEEDIKQTFSNFEIYNIFSCNKKILLFIFMNKIINAKDFIKDLLEKREQVYHLYFYPEIKSFVDEETKKKIEEEISKFDFFDDEEFDEYRKIGQNDSYICKLIRNDSIEEFVSYVTKNNVSLSRTIIKQSIFETNSFLIKNKETSLIEYAAFFGSIQVFNYLKMNNVELKPSLWLYAIHGMNAELIHILEDLHVTPNDETYEEVFKEAIKCHHNDIANYINDNLLDQDVEQDNIEINYDENTLSYSFHYYNYEYFPSNFNNKFIFYYACQYDHYQIVDLLLKNKKLKINDKIVFKKLFNEICDLFILIAFYLFIFSTELLI